MNYLSIIKGSRLWNIHAKECTAIVLEYKRRERKTFDDMAGLLNLSKVTLYRKKDDHSWTKPEMYFIANLMKK